MSQSLIVKGIYKNNKTNVIGLHNPKNNRTINIDEIKHIYKMHFTHFKKGLNKYKKIEVIYYMQNGEKRHHQLTNEIMKRYKNYIKIAIRKMLKDI